MKINFESWYKPALPTGNIVTFEVEAILTTEHKREEVSLSKKKKIYIYIYIKINFTWLCFDSL
jgi:hypothetical protein